MSNPAPPGWNKTVDDLMSEISQGSRQQLSVTDDEFQWAVDYERSLLPAGTVFPRKNQVWQTVHGCEVRFIAVFADQPARGGAARLPHGERVLILANCDQPISVSFQPVRYDELHERIVPEDVRRMPGYRGYLLDQKLTHLNEH